MILACALALAGAQAAFAADPAVEKRYTPAYDRCLKSPEGQSTMGLIECMGDELKVQDARLNAAYAKAMADLTPAQKESLRTAQRAWVAFRDADCQSLVSEDWGTASRVAGNECMVRRTVERTLELEDYPPQ